MAVSAGWVGEAGEVARKVALVKRLVQKSHLRNGRCLVRLCVDRNKARAPLGLSGGAFSLLMDLVRS